MKKIFSIMAVAALTLGFTACEDIPSPYEIFDEIIGGEDEEIYYESSACYTGWNLELGKDQTITYNPWSQGSSYTQATGYQKWDGSDSKSNKEAEGFLVSPKFKTTAKDNNVVFSFDYCIGYAQNDKDFAKHTKLYVSKTYNEGAIDLAEWEQIDWVPTHTSTDWTLANTGNIALPEAYQNEDNVHVAFWFYAPAGGSATFEIMNFVMETGEAGAQPDVPGGDDTPSAEPAGDGSQANPFNVAATIDFVNKLEKNTKSEPVYIKGIVKKFKSGEEPGNSYGNATFYIVDSEDASEDFYCYRVMGPGNKDFTSADQLKVGDEVVVYGPLTLYSSSYGDTPETVQKECYVYSINGKVEEGGNNESSSDNALPYSSASLYQGWTTLAGAAKNPWSQGSSYTQATGYQKWDGADSKSNAEVDGYLISPSINTKAKGTDVKMSFEYCVAYANNDADFAKHIKVYVSNKADGSSFKAAEWKQLDWTATHTTTDWTLATEEIQLPAEFVNQENVHVAFWFYAPADKSSTFELKNFKMLEGKVGESDPSDNPPVVSGSSENGDFESWSGSTPLHWIPASTAGGATLSQSTDAHGGKYSVKVGGATTNKRLGREEMTLEAGEYTMTFWVKAATEKAASIIPGYVAVKDGKTGSYNYRQVDGKNSYENDITDKEWRKVTYTFNLAETGIYCLVIMNSKTTGTDVLVDDFVLTKGDTKIISSRKRAAARRK